MANSNTIALDTALPSAAQGVSTSSEFQLQNAAGVPATIKLEGNKLKNKRFLLVATGRCFGTGTENLTIRFMYGTDTTIGNNAALFSSGAKAINATNGSWMLEAEVVLDASNQKIEGIGYGHIANIVIAQAQTSVVTGVNLADTAIGTGSDKKAKEIGFTVCAQFSVSDPANWITLDSFELEAL